MIITNKNVKLGLKSFKLSLPLLYQELHPFTLAKRNLAKHYNYFKTKHQEEQKFIKIKEKNNT